MDYSRSILFVLSVVLAFGTATAALNSDGLSLLALKAAIDDDPSGILRHWSDSDATPCRWPGVVCTRRRVTDLYLPNRGFSGYIPSELGRLDSLRRLGLARNNLSGPIPAHLFQARSLLAVDLSRNSLSGQIPSQIGTLASLRHLDLSSNSLNGSLPEALADLPGLVGTLNLSFNRFSGEIPPAYGKIPVFVSLDLRHNNLTGKIPQVGSLLNQGPTAFSGNPSLCGFPLENECSEKKSPKSGERNVAGEEPQKPLISNPDSGEERARNGGASMAIPIISGVSVVVGIVSVSTWLFRRRRTSEGKTGKPEKEGFESDAFGDVAEGQKGKFAVVDEGFGLDLEDLLRASAYVVGKSRRGIVYRVVAGGGKGSSAAATVVAVRRLSECEDATWKLKDFEAEMEAIGRVHHPNIVRLRAYYYASDEKLLITDFVRSGSLYAALHGGPSSNLPPLTWPARLKIAQGTARGLMYIHEHSPRKHVHGSLKSTKILLDDDLGPHISGFGLTRLATSASKKPSSSVHLAPEARAHNSKLTQKCDVYSFGVVLLEILTGKTADENLEAFVRSAFREEKPLSEIIDANLLGEVHAKKQVVSAFHIALNCTEFDPEMRPRMKAVSESLDRVRVH